MTFLAKCAIIKARLGVAQLVARDFWEVEVAGSSPVTQTIFKNCLGLAQLVARTHGVREVGSSSLLSQTNSP